MKKKTVYVCVASWGSYDEHDTVVIYASTSYPDAVRAMTEYSFPNTENNWGYVETWENGKKIKDDLVRE
jgi:hypothetical protein